MVPLIILIWRYACLKNHYFMNELNYSVAGRPIRIRLKRSARKNIILRALSHDSISINIPPRLSRRQLENWLANNQTVLLDVLARAPENTAGQRPGHIWYLGMPHQLGEHDAAHIAVDTPKLLLPPQAWPQQQAQLRRFLQQRARERLLPRLAEHSERLALFPAAMDLSNARGFWGVCRARTGIRLNWRLIGAPDFVLDYICVHELCHLPHPDHSPRFWALVNRHTPHTDAAKRWLKQHGSELFWLDAPR